VTSKTSRPELESALTGSVFNRLFDEEDAGWTEEADGRGKAQKEGPSGQTAWTSGGYPERRFPQNLHQRAREDSNL